MIHLLLSLLACSDPPELRGRVVDIWGNPVEGATVMLPGAGERPLTDANGVYAMQHIPGEHEMRAGKEGYIQEAVKVDLKPDDTKGPTFKLYKKPEKIGFYAVTLGDYLEVAPATVRVIGHQVDAIYGIEAPPDRMYLEGEKLQIVYKIDLEMHQLMKLGLEIRKMKWVNEVRMVSVTGGQETPVPINLFVDDGPVPFTLTRLKSKGFYLLETTEPLGEGMYVIQAQNLLDPKDAEAWNRIPEELRLVHPIRIK